jgi:hypothetical protein
MGRKPLNKINGQKNWKAKIINIKSNDRLLVGKIAKHTDQTVGRLLRDWVVLAAHKEAKRLGMKI